MIRYGGDFVSALGRALYHADSENADKIKQTWPEYWETYTRFAQQDDEARRMSKNLLDL